jgi:hypothetical protein
MAMGKIREPKPVKLIIAILSASPEYEKEIRSILIEKFGPEEFTSGPFPFTFTNYYADELGQNPMRTLISYENLIPRIQVPDIKLWTNQQEFRFDSQTRLVNLDPGYLTLGQFFLATTKDQRQRVYIRDGIFVEPTLFFQENQWQPFPWTYPDYKSTTYLEFFQSVRSHLAYQLKTNIPYRLRTNKTN